MKTYKKPVNPETAVRVFWMYSELGNKEIKELFGCIGAETIMRYKKTARNIMIEKGITVCGKFTVDTKCAYEAWGIDIDDYEKRLAKLRKLGMVE